ncbi:unnamed protein product [Cyprideis torosa]|uniref:Uncharacterized protein n=1 Tax=Cyprideis torosa TaxID=163714 RepID=A0A7R8WIR2_9CRUS|nr:unnamed protein product [Cyprideis torosa]CAG0894389.1 unnamed protein product [Cyprideis torosa]
MPGFRCHEGGPDQRNLSNGFGVLKPRAIGDQILEANGVTFTSITHQEAVRLLKKARRFLFRLRYVGRVPNSAAFDEDVTCPGVNQVDNVFRCRHSSFSPPEVPQPDSTSFRPPVEVPPSPSPSRSATYSK